ncbi:glycosyltransferase [Curtobacterium sp. AG1037]|uniref:glycosyltransferase n=1 Tax=Curtobacterium sp. AG1037 TaxID=2183990 RepID=UPI000E0CB8F8|nr:glycosyltransferase [Curtobacterium sp. AG1037]
MSDGCWDVPSARAAMGATASARERAFLLRRIAVLTKVARGNILMSSANRRPDATESSSTVTYCILASVPGTDLCPTLSSLPPGADVLVVGVDDVSEMRPADRPDLRVTAIPFRWRNDFAAARNAGLDAAGEGWVVFVDTDEVFVPQASESLEEVLRHFSQHPASGRLGVSLRVWDGNRGTVSRVGRVMRADGLVRYRGALHEELFVRGGVVLQVDLDCDLVHDGYDGAAGADKARRNQEVLDAVVARGEATAKDHYYRSRDARPLRTDEATEADLRAAIVLGPQTIAFQGEPHVAAIRDLIGSQLQRGAVSQARSTLETSEQQLDVADRDSLALSIEREALRQQARQIRSRVAAQLLGGSEADPGLLDDLGLLSLLVGDDSTAWAVLEGRLGGTVPDRFREAAIGIRDALERLGA